MLADDGFMGFTDDRFIGDDFTDDRFINNGFTTDGFT